MHVLLTNVLREILQGMSPDHKHNAQHMSLRVLPTGTEWGNIFLFEI